MCGAEEVSCPFKDRNGTLLVIQPYALENHEGSVYQVGSSTEWIVICLSVVSGSVWQRRCIVLSQVRTLLGACAAGEVTECRAMWLCGWPCDSGIAAPDRDA